MSDVVRTIGKGKQDQASKKQASRLTVDKYFFFGTLTGFFGILYLGVHLWLMRNGILSPWKNYHSLRELHALLQVYLFLGTFIVGFLLQATPKLFATRKELAHYGTNFLLLLYVSAAIKFLSPFRIFSLPLAATFVLLAFIIFSVVRVSTKEIFFSLGVPFLVSLICFAIGAFFDMGNPYQALFVVWGGVGGAIFGAGQQFVATVLGGSRLRVRTAIACWLLFVASLTFLLLASLYAPQLYWVMFAYCAVATILLYGYGSGLHRAFMHPRADSLYVGTLFAWCWALIGALYALQDSAWVDYIVHTWAIGWATTLILVIVPRIIGFLRARDAIRTWILMIIVLVWQLVPIGRDFDWILGRGGAWLAPAAATISFGIWVPCVLFSCATLFMQNRTLDSNRR